MYLWFSFLAVGLFLTASTEFGVDKRGVGDKVPMVDMVDGNDSATNSSTTSKKRRSLSVEEVQAAQRCQAITSLIDRVGDNMDRMHGNAVKTSTSRAKGLTM